MRSHKRHGRRHAHYRKPDEFTVKQEAKKPKNGFMRWLTSIFSKIKRLFVKEKPTYDKSRPMPEQPRPMPEQQKQKVEQQKQKVEQQKPKVEQQKQKVEQPKPQVEQLKATVEQQTEQKKPKAEQKKQQTPPPKKKKQYAPQKPPENPIQFPKGTISGTASFQSSPEEARIEEEKPAQAEPSADAASKKSPETEQKKEDGNVSKASKSEPVWIRVGDPIGDDLKVVTRGAKLVRNAQQARRN